MVGSGAISCVLDVAWDDEDARGGDDGSSSGDDGARGGDNSGADRDDEPFGKSSKSVSDSVSDSLAVVGLDGGAWGKTVPELGTGRLLFVSSNTCISVNSNSMIR